MAQMTARNAHEKRARFGAAPAASPARHVGPQFSRWVLLFLNTKTLFNYVYQHTLDNDRLQTIRILVAILLRMLVFGASMLVE